MSYILKALKKSEQERARGTVPKLATARADDGEERSRIWPMVATAALSVNIAVVALILWQPGPLFWESGIAEAEIAPAPASRAVEPVTVAEAGTEYAAAMPMPADRSQSFEPSAKLAPPEPLGQPAATEAPAAQPRAADPPGPEQVARQDPEPATVAAQAAVPIDAGPDRAQTMSGHGGDDALAARPLPAALTEAAEPAEASAEARVRLAALSPRTVEPEPMATGRAVGAAPIPGRKPVALPAPVVEIRSPLSDRRPAVVTAVVEETQLARAVAEPAVEPVAESADGGLDSGLYRDLPELWQMPPAFRAGVPKLNISVHVYAPQPSSRFVIIDRKKYWEGDELNNGLLIEAIVPQGLVMDYQGRQFRIGSR